MQHRVAAGAMRFACISQAYILGLRSELLGCSLQKPGNASLPHGKRGQEHGWNRFSADTGT